MCNKCSKKCSEYIKYIETKCIDAKRVEACKVDAKKLLPQQKVTLELFTPENAEDPTPAGKVRVSIIEEDDGNKFTPVSLLNFSATTVTVTRVSDIVSIKMGDGAPFNNIVWTQQVATPANGPLLLDFTGTEVADLIVGGGNKVVQTWPNAFNPANLSTGTLQIGAARGFLQPAEPLLKIYPRSYAPNPATDLGWPIAQGFGQEGDVNAVTNFNVSYSL